MKIRFKGLNVSLGKKDEFEFEHPNQTSTDLDELYFTFESVYFISKLTKIPYILDMEHEPKLFKKLLFTDANQLLSVCTNTNFLWCLMLNTSTSILELLKYASHQHIETFHIPNVQAQAHLVLIATDVNVYLFENSGEFKCVYELIKRSDLDKKRLEKEFNLNEDSISSMPLNEILLNERIEQFSPGKEHILMLASKTKNVYSFGIGTKSQLGTSNIENSFEPILIECLRDQTILSIGSGLSWHAACLNDNGECYVWGWNSHGQLGVDFNELNSAFGVTPIKLNIFDDFGRSVKFKKISLGSNHSCLIDSENYLYSFGWNKYSQLFLDEEINKRLKSSKNLEDEEEGESDDEIDDESEEVKCLEQVDEPEKFTEFKVLDVKCGFWSTLVLKLE
jgi:hypothetical protein